MADAEALRRIMESLQFPVPEEKLSPGIVRGTRFGLANLLARAYGRLPNEWLNKIDEIRVSDKGAKAYRTPEGITGIDLGQYPLWPTASAQAREYPGYPYQPPLSNPRQEAERVALHELGHIVLKPNIPEGELEVNRSEVAAEALAIALMKHQKMSPQTILESILQIHRRMPPTRFGGPSIEP